MSKHIAIVLTITGIVKVLNETQGERVLQPGDVIFDDDILFAFTESTISTKHGVHIQLKVGEQWEFENGQFIVSSSQEKAVNAVSDFLSSISFQTVGSETKIAPFADEGFGPVYRVNQSGNSGYVLRIGEELQPHLLYVNNRSNTSTRGFSTDIGITLGDGFNSSFYLDDFISFKKAFYALLAGGINPTLDELLRLDVQRIDQYNIGSVQGNIRRVVADNIEISTIDQLQDIADTAIEILNKIVKAAIENNATSETATIDELDRIGINNIDSSILIPFFSVLNKLNVVGSDVDTSAEIQGIVDAYNKVLFAADGVDNNNAALNLNDFKALGISSINSPSDVELMNAVLDLKINTDIIDVESIQTIADSYRAVLSAADGIDNSSNLALTDFENLELSHINSAAKAQLLADIIDIKEQTEVNSYAKLQQIAAVVSHVIEVADTNTTSLGINEYLLIDIAGVNELNLALVFQAIQATLANGSQIDTLAELQNLVNTTIYLDINADTGRADDDQYTADTQINILNADTSGLWHYSTDGGSNWFVGSGNSFSVPTDMFFNSADIQVKAVNSTGSLRYANLAALTTDNTSDDINLVLAQDSGSSNTDNITVDNQVDVVGLEALSNWSYSLDSGDNWLLGSSASFNVAQNTTYINNAIQVRSVDLAGNEFSATMGPLTTDGLADAVSLVLNSDDGVSNTDNITSDTTILLLGLEGLTSWQYSTDTGVTWFNGVGNTFSLSPDTLYINDQIQVKTADLAGNVHIEKMPQVVINDPVSAISDTDGIFGANGDVSENAIIGTAIGITAFAEDADAVDTVSYTLNATDIAEGLFAIDATTGIVTLAGNIDYETATSHTFQVIATSTDGSTSTENFTINVGDNNSGIGGGSGPDDDHDVGVITDTDPTTGDVSENAIIGTAIGISAFAEDADAVDTVSFTLSSADLAAGLFAIDSATGIVTLAGNLDYETATSHTIQVIATSTDGSTSTENFTINVGDNNSGIGGGSGPDDDHDVGVITDTDATTGDVSENAIIGTVIGISAFAEDADAVDTVSYTLSFADLAAGLFAIDSATGIVTLAGNLDYETATSHTIQVIATSTDGSTSTENFTINVGDNNSGIGGGSGPDDDHDVGVITDTDATTGDVSENAIIGTVIGISAFAEDADAVDTVSYTLSFADLAAGLFAIDSATGIVTLAGNLDYETATSHTFQVIATSTDGSTSTENFTINVGDNNSGIGGGSGPDDDHDVGVITDTDPTTGDVSENAIIGTAIGITAFAEDADAVDTVSYTLSSADLAAGLFAIDSATGIVTLAGNLDYETATSHTFQVIATSTDGSTSTENFTINVGDNNSGIGGGSGPDDDHDVGVITDTDPTTGDVSENAIIGTAIGISAFAEDADAVDTVSFTLSSADLAAGLFAIDSATGIVTLAGNLDYETATSHTFQVIATSTDGSTSTENFTINVGDNNSGIGGGSGPDDDHDVGVITDTDPTTGDVSENAIIGTAIGISAFAEDADAVDTVSYTLSFADLAAGLFAIDSATGIVTLAGNLDYETATSHTFQVIATSTDGSTSTENFTINVGDNNSGIGGGSGPDDDHDVGVITDTDPTTGDVSENAIIGTAIGISAFAEDADAVDTVSYTLSSADLVAGLFAIDSATGIVTLAGNFDYETATSHTFQVIATSTDGSTSTENFTINVGDNNSGIGGGSGPDDDHDVGVITDTDATTGDVSENAIIGTAIGISAFAEDADVVDTVSYTLSSADLAAGLFAIDSATGIVTLAGNFDYETATSHTFQVIATSTDGSTSTENFTINVGDNNSGIGGGSGPDDDHDVGVITDTDPTTGDVSENAIIGTAIGISAFAEDADAVDTVSYTLSSADLAAGLFAIDSATGIVTLAGNLDYETATSHTFQVIATSTDGSTSTENFTINVGDNNSGIGGGSGPDDDHDVGVITDTDATTGDVSENAIIGTAIGISAFAEDADAVDTVSYTLSSADIAEGLFAIDATTGIVTLAGNLDYETATSHTFQVIATSTDGSTSTENFTINVGDNNSGIGGGGSTGDTDNAVGAITDSDVTVDLVSENAASGVAVGITGLATDADGDIVTYSLSDDAGGRFNINSSTGVITVANASLLDYETNTSHNITIVATSADGSTNNSALAIAVGDNNNGAGGGGSTGDTDNAVGTITDSDVTVDLVSENAANGVAVGITGLATDADGDLVTYSLSDNAGGRFSIDSNTGVITVTNASLLDYETNTSHNITIVATSADGSTSNSTLAIAVGDNNNGAGGGGSTGDTDNPVGVITDSDATLEFIAEDALNGALAGVTALANDIDSGDTVTYSLSDNANGRFAIDANSGIVTVLDSTQLDYETNTNHNITVLATSLDGSTSSETINIVVGDINDAPTIVLMDIDNDLTDITVIQETDHIIGKVSDIDGSVDFTASTATALHGTVSLDSVTGNIIYRSTSSDFTDSVTLSIVDDDGAITTQVIPITVNLAPIDIIVTGSQGLVVEEEPIFPTFTGDTASVDVSVTGSLLGNTTDGWNTLVHSVEREFAANGVEVSFQMSSANSAVQGVFGLNASHYTVAEAGVSATYEIIDYAIEFNFGWLRIYESGVVVVDYFFGSVDAVYTINIRDTDGQVTYLKDGVIFYTSLTNATLSEEYWFTAATHSNGEGIINLEFSYTQDAWVYEDAGANTSVATIVADDSDSSTWTYSLVSGEGDIDNAAVFIGGAGSDEIFLVNSLLTDKEHYFIRVEAIDEYGNRHEEIVNFKVTANQAPADIKFIDSLGEDVDSYALVLIGETSKIDVSAKGTLISNTTTSWNSLVHSEEAVLASDGVSVSFQMSAEDQETGLFGLNASHYTTTEAGVTYTFQIIDYGLFFSYGRVRVEEDGVEKSVYIDGTVDDVYTINIDGNSGEVTYLKNGIVFYTSLINATLSDEYWFTAAHLAYNTGITNLDFSGATQIRVYENSGINSVVASLSTEDADSTTWTYSLVSGLGDDDNAAVSIGGTNNDKLILIANPQIATQEHYSVRVEVIDNHGNSYQEVVKLYVVLNQAPQDMFALDQNGIEVNTFNSIPSFEGDGVVDVDLTTPGSIVKTDAENNWSNLVTSQEHIIASSGVNVQFQALNNGHSGIWGLDAVTAGVTSTYNDIDFGFFMPDLTTLTVNESGVDVASFGAFLTSDVLSINIDKVSGEVIYFKNGVLLYTSLVAANLTAEYAFSGAPRFFGGGIKNVLLSSNSQLSVYDGEGAGQVAAVLGVEDDDSASWSYALVSGAGDTDNGVVSIGGVGNNELILSTSPLMATQSTYSVRVQVTDDFGNTYQEVVSFRVVLNQAPIDITVTGSQGLVVEQDLIFPNFIGDTAKVDTSVAGAVLSNTTNGWNSLVHSSQKEIASNGVNVSFKGSSDSYTLGMFGLNANHYTIIEAGVNATYKVIDYAIYFSGAQVKVHEHGIGIGSFIQGSINDVYTINIRDTDGQVTYLKNGIVFYTSLTNAVLSDSYWFSAATFAPGEGIIDLVFSYTSDVQINEEVGINTSAATLGANDSDSSAWTYSLVSGDGDTDNAAVFIGGVSFDELFIVNSLLSDKEHYSVRIEAVDNHGNSYQEIVNIRVIINQAPTDIKLIDHNGVDVNYYSAPTLFGELDEVDLSSEGSIFSTTTGGWNTLIHSEEQVLASDGVDVSFQMSTIIATPGVFGLNASHYTIAEAGGTNSFDVIDFGIYFDNGAVSVYENGVPVFLLGTATIDDVFSISINSSDGKVTYLKNGVVFYASLINANLTDDFWFTAAPYTNGAGITDLDFSYIPLAPIYENSGVNSVVGTLAADDQDSSAWSYSLISGTGDDDNAAVSIGGTSNNQLILTANPIIATQQQYSVRVQVTDEFGHTYQEIIKFEVQVNSAPTDIITETISYSLDVLGDILDVNTSTEGSIIKSTGSDGVGSVIYSEAEILASEGIKMEFQASSAGATIGIWGLDPDTNTSSFDYAIFLAATQLYIIEDTTIKGTFDAHTANDVFAIEVDKETGEVTYVRNGVIFYTSLIAASLTSEYRMMGNPNEDGQGVTNLSITSLSPHIYENTGINSTVTTLSATDDDSTAWTYSLVSGVGDNDNAAVSIGGTSNNEIILTENPNIATQQSYSVRVQVTDDYGKTYQEVVEFYVVLNQGPQDILTLGLDSVEINTFNGVPNMAGDVSEVDLSTPGVIVKTANNNSWGTLVFSQEKIIASSGVNLEFQTIDTDHSGIWGLSATALTTASSRNDINYGFFLPDSSAIFIYENGVNQGSIGAHALSDVLSINIDGETGEVTYLLNGSVVHTSTTPADLSLEYGLLGDPSFVGNGIKNLVLSSNTQLTVYDGEGVGQTAIVLGVDDDDSTSWSYALVSGAGDTDNGVVSIGGVGNNELILSTSPLMATQSAYSVRVQVTDDFGNQYEEVMEFSVVVRTASTPLILDLDGDGVETLSVSQGVLFDIDADGVLEHTGWVNPDDGLLAIDINGDGVINDASELLGEHSINSDGNTARDGFDALDDYDLNLDGVINADDEIYTSLLIWQDSNSDGVSQAHELYSLLDLGVESLSLESVIISEDNQGNTAGLRSSWTDTSGNINIVDDVWFAYKDEDSELLLLSDILEEPAMDVLAALTPVAAENNSSLDQQSTLLLETAYISDSHLDVVSLELPIDY